MCTQKFLSQLRFVSEVRRVYGCSGSIEVVLPVQHRSSHGRKDQVAVSRHDVTLYQHLPTILFVQSVQSNHFIIYSISWIFMACYNTPRNVDRPWCFIKSSEIGWSTCGTISDVQLRSSHLFQLDAMTFRKVWPFSLLGGRWVIGDWEEAKTGDGTRKLWEIWVLKDSYLCKNLTDDRLSEFVSLSRGALVVIFVELFALSVSFPLLSVNTNCTRSTHCENTWRQMGWHLIQHN